MDLVKEKLTLNWEEVHGACGQPITKLNMIVELVECNFRVCIHSASSRLMHQTSSLVSSSEAQMLSRQLCPITMVSIFWVILQPEVTLTLTSSWEAQLKKLSRNIRNLLAYQSCHHSGRWDSMHLAMDGTISIKSRMLLVLTKLLEFLWNLYGLMAITWRTSKTFI